MPAKIELVERPSPRPGLGHVRVRVHAAGVNRADLLQRLGGYPAPPDAPADIPGLEVAGVVDELGPGVSEWSVGDRVFGIVGGGAAAESIALHARTLARIPDELDFVSAAAVPEVFVTAYDAMITQAGLSAGESVLVHAAGSGVGTAAIQLARAIGARPLGTARSAHKLTQAKELGLEQGWVPTKGAGDAPSFSSEVRAATGGRGVDVVVDLVGGSYLPESLASLAERGRLVLVGLLAGARAEVDLGLVLRRRLRVFGTVLRSRPLEEKILAAQLLGRHIAPLLARGIVRPIVHRVVPLTEIEDAYDLVARGETFGKVVLEIAR